MLLSGLVHFGFLKKEIRNKIIIKFIIFYNDEILLLTGVGMGDDHWGFGKRGSS